MLMLFIISDTPKHYYYFYHAFKIQIDQCTSMCGFLHSDDHDKYVKALTYLSRSLLKRFNYYGCLIYRTNKLVTIIIHVT